MWSNGGVGEFRRARMPDRWRITADTARPARTHGNIGVLNAVG